jgi:DNA-binding transcriptional regulator PaaX
MSKKDNTLVIEILSVLKDLGKMMPLPFETPYSWIRRYSGVPRKKYRDTIYQMEKRGVVKSVKKSSSKFLQLTKKGELELLLIKAVRKKHERWDGKWRVIIFDIPEQARKFRDRFRWLLKKNGYKKIQQSVFINPHPLNKEAIEYLKASGLMQYIRILRVDLIDDDRQLRKLFGMR